MLLKIKSGHSALRYNVRKFIIKSDHPRITEFRRQYEETVGRVSRETWNAYWTRMTRDGTWVDYWFVQATAWYLELDVWIIATSSTDSSPYIAISGNIEDGNIPCDAPIITIGTKSNCHYQSLLPIEMFHLEFNNPQQDPTETRELFNKVSETETEKNLQNESQSRPQRTNSPLRQNTTETHEINKDSRQSSCGKQEQNQESKLPNETRVPQQKSELIVNEPQKEQIPVQVTKLSSRERPLRDTQQDQKEKQIDKEDNYIPFVYTYNGKKLTFQRMSHDYKMRCPACGNETKYIIQHLNKSKCKKNVHIDDFKNELKA